MRHVKLPLINETVCNDKCQFWMEVVYFLGLNIQDIFNLHLYVYISFNF